MYFRALNDLSLVAVVTGTNGQCGLDLQ